jgi:hypothetical protein
MFGVVVVIPCGAVAAPRAVVARHGDRNAHLTTVNAHVIRCEGVRPDLCAIPVVLLATLVGDATLTGMFAGLVAAKWLNRHRERSALPPVIRNRPRHPVQPLLATCMRWKPFPVYRWRTRGDQGE